MTLEGKGSHEFRPRALPAASYSFPPKAVIQVGKTAPRSALGAALQERCIVKEQPSPCPQVHCTGPEFAPQHRRRCAGAGAIAPPLTRRRRTRPPLRRTGSLRERPSCPRAALPAGRRTALPESKPTVSANAQPRDRPRGTEAFHSPRVAANLAGASISCSVGPVRGCGEQRTGGRRRTFAEMFPSQ